jgi:hypothetical protein
MTQNDSLTQINKQIRSKRPSTKVPAPANNTIDAAALKQRIERVRKQLADLEAALGRMSGTRRLVRMVKDFGVRP